jgi:hypothetical protein
MSTEPSAIEAKQEAEIAILANTHQASIRLAEQREAFSRRIARVQMALNYVDSSNRIQCEEALENESVMPMRATAIATYDAAQDLLYLFFTEKDPKP